MDEAYATVGKRAATRRYKQLQREELGGSWRPNKAGLNVHL